MMVHVHRNNYTYLHTSTFKYVHHINTRYNNANVINIYRRSSGPVEPRVISACNDRHKRGYTHKWTALLSIITIANAFCAQPIPTRPTTTDRRHRSRLCRGRYTCTHTRAGGTLFILRAFSNRARDRDRGRYRETEWENRCRKNNICVAGRQGGISSGTASWRTAERLGWLA